MLKNIEGQPVPHVTIQSRKDGQWITLDTKNIFEGKKVILFALPGAYTPTCSTTHLPRYNELYPVFKENGVDKIVCLSVNDPFVMNEWLKDQNTSNIDIIPDGNGAFTDKMGMLVDKSNLSFGKRSWRYSMLVNDGVIEKMFIEPEVDGDPFEVSDADTMLSYINKNANKPKSTAIITKEGCPHCARAKKLLTEKGYAYEEITVGQKNTNITLKALSNSTTVPQVFIEGELIGGADDLEKYFQ